MPPQQSPLRPRGALAKPICVSAVRRAMNAQAFASALFASRLASVTAVLFSQAHERAEALTEQLLTQATSDAERLDALLARGNVLLTVAKAAEGRAVAEQARELARTLGQTLHELDAACLLGQALAQQQHVPEAIELMESFKPLMQSCGDAARRLRYWTGLAYILQIADKRSLCAEALTESVALAEELGDLAEVVVCTSNLSAITIYLGLPSVAYTTAERAYRLCQRLGDTESVTAGSIQIQLGLSSLMLGSYSRAIGRLSEALSKFMHGGGAPWRSPISPRSICTSANPRAPGPA